MTQEQKELLLKDLCARLPYGVKVNAPFTTIKSENAKGYKINSIKFGVVEWTPILFGEKKQRSSIIIESFSEKYNQFCSIDIELNNDIERVKPYLFPLSSMTEEQEKDIFHNGKFYIDHHNSICRFPTNEDDYDFVTMEDCLEIFNKLNKYHFDYRGLIPMGLAIDATGLDIY